MKEARAAVKDYTTGEWIDARKAYLCQYKTKFRTPMGMGHCRI